MRFRSVKPSLLAVVLLALSGCSIELQHDLSEQDANDIYVLLSENGIAATKRKEEGGNEPKYLISVAKQDASQAAKLLREYSLPRPAPPGYAEIIKAKGMIPTAVEERVIFLNGVAGEVTQALNRVDGVLESKVIVQIPEKNDLSQPDKIPLPTASAFVKYRVTLDGQPPLKEESVRRFVAAAVEDLKPEHVQVIMSQAQAPAADTDPMQRLQDVMGMRMTASSASQFKVMVALAALVILGMTAFTTWNFLRSNAAPKPARRAARNPEA